MESTSRLALRLSTSPQDALYHVISTNNPPTLEDLNLATARIAEVNLELEPLQAEIKALEMQLSLFRERELSHLGSDNPLAESIQASKSTDEDFDGPTAQVCPPGPLGLEGLRIEIESMDRVDSELKLLQGEMQDLASQLAPLHKREKSLLQSKWEHTPILSPWRKLPPEIISEILQEAVNPVSLSFLSESNTSTDRFHFKNLRAVCRLWREIAFGTHSLWTSVWVDFDQYPDRKQLGVIQAIGSYFRRGGPSLPLNIGFKWRRMPEDGGPLPGEAGRAFDAWMDYLFSQRSRWEEITFYSQAYHFKLLEDRLRIDLSLGKGAWRTLFLQVSVLFRNLTVAPTARPRTVGPHVFHKCFPTLKTMHVSSEDDILPADGPFMLLDGHPTLHKLRLNVYRDINPYFAKLGGFPNLRKLLVNCCRWDIEPTQSDCPIYEFPCLELLVVSCLPSFSILSKLRTPALRTLQILTTVPSFRSHGSTASLQRELWTGFSHVITFIGQCNQNLREFYMNCWFLQGDDSLRRLLEALSSVERLCIDTWFTGQGEGGSVQFVLENTIQNSTYLPKLQKFCMHPPHRRTVKLLKWVSSRQGASSADFDPPPEGEQSPGAVAAAASTDPTLPFARGSFSWPSFGAFLKSTRKRRKEVAGGGSGNSSSKSNFRVCVPGEVCDAVGRDGQAVVQSLVDDGLAIDRVASCKIMW